MTEQSENKKIAQLARQYKAEGYEVYANLGGFPRPELFAGYEPDLVVRKGKETIIIEVKGFGGRESEQRQQAIKQLATYAAGTKGVRFDLVVTRPKKKRIEMRLAELYSLRASLWNTLESSVKASEPYLFGVIAGVVLEDILNSAATKKEWSGQGDIWTGSRKTESLTQFARQLRENSIISDAVLQFSLQVWRMRNEAAHLGSVRITVEDRKEVLRKMRSLADSYGWWQRSARPKTEPK